MEGKIQGLEPFPWGSPNADPLGDLQDVFSRMGGVMTQFAAITDTPWLRAMEAAFLSFEGRDMSSTPDEALYPGPIMFRRKPVRPGMPGYHARAWWLDEIWEFTRAVVPEPIPGGTFCYCPMGCYRNTNRAGFRTEAAYRRHYRRQHL